MEGGNSNFSPNECFPFKIPFKIFINCVEPGGNGVNGSPSCTSLSLLFMRARRLSCCLWLSVENRTPGTGAVAGSIVAGWLSFSFFFFFFFFFALPDAFCAAVWALAASSSASTTSPSSTSIWRAASSASCFLFSKKSDHKCCESDEGDESNDTKSGWSSNYVKFVKWG